MLPAMPGVRDDLHLDSQVQVASGPPQEEKVGQMITISASCIPLLRESKQRIADRAERACEGRSVWSC